MSNRIEHSHTRMHVTKSARNATTVLWLILWLLIRCRSAISNDLVFPYIQTTQLVFIFNEMDFFWNEIKMLHTLNVRWKSMQANIIDRWTKSEKKTRRLIERRNGSFTSSTLLLMESVNMWRWIDCLLMTTLASPSTNVNQTYYIIQQQQKNRNSCVSNNLMKNSVD